MNCHDYGIKLINETYDINGVKDIIGRYLKKKFDILKNNLESFKDSMNEYPRDDIYRYRYRYRRELFLQKQLIHIMKESDDINMIKSWFNRIFKEYRFIESDEYLKNTDS